MNSYNPFFYWNADPVLINLGPISIHWYGLLFALAFIIGLQIMRWVYKREQRPASELDSLFIYILLGTIIGARLGHVVFYDPGFYFSQPLEIIKIWRGGLASHGGALGIIIAVYLYARLSERPSTAWILDRFCMTAALGGAFIRIGNFFNSEIIGHAVDGGVVFIRYDLMPRHPVQLYEACAYLIIFFITFFAYRYTKIIHSEGRLLGLFLIILFSARVFLERFKLQQANYELSGDWTVGQWLSLPLIVIGLWLLLRREKT
jgi:prolipoprotein diacylglyceryl transferase